MNERAPRKWLIGLAAGAVVVVLAFLASSVLLADRSLDEAITAEPLPIVDMPFGDALDQDAIVFASDRTGTFELYLRSADGDIAPLTDDPGVDSWRPRISPDRRTLLFYRTPAGIGDRDLTQASLWMIAALGGTPVEVLPVDAHGWTMQGHAEWSPNGAELAMMAGTPDGIRVQVTSTDGRSVRPLSDWPGDQLDPSWSPDGKRIAFIGCPQPGCDRNGREVFAVVASGDERPIQITGDAVQDAQPQFSPAGDQVAVRSLIQPAVDDQPPVWQVRVVPISRRTQPAPLFDDSSISAAPIWVDADTLLFGHIVEGTTSQNIVRYQLSSGELALLVQSDADDRDPTG